MLRAVDTFAREPTPRHRRSRFYVSYVLHGDAMWNLDRHRGASDPIRSRLDAEPVTGAIQLFEPSSSVVETDAVPSALALEKPDAVIGDNDLHASVDCRRVDHNSALPRAGGQPMLYGVLDDRLQEELRHQR